MSGQGPCESDYEPSGESILDEFLRSPMVSDFFSSYGLEMPDPSMLYEQLNSLTAPSPCAHTVDNCMWKEQAQPLIDHANDQIAEIERFYQENNVEEMLEEYLGANGFDYSMIYMEPEELDMLKSEIGNIQDFVDKEHQCIMPTEVAGAMDWALDQLDMCGSGATSFIIGASTLLVASIAF